MPETTSDRQRQPARITFGGPLLVFSSLTFLFFFLPIALAGNFLLPREARNLWLLLASLFFYAWGAHKFVLVMILSILANFAFARLIEAKSGEGTRKALLAGAIAFNLGILFYNKYMNFFTENLSRLLGDSVTVTRIVLPIGISFFTFQALSYVVDVYRRDTPAQRSPWNVGLYIAMFPQLIAGPIVRYRTIAEQIEGRSVSLEAFTRGIWRFCSGLAMKVLLANQMGVVADGAFGLAKSPEQLSVSFAWLGALAYSLQILFDFAGYSAMAIGLGLMFGFQFPENFNHPYVSRTVTEFWRRWHMSLGQWFRDYVYFPLGGSRVGSRLALVRNLLIVWTLTGVWHGAAWTFVLWGLGYAVLLTFVKLTGLSHKALSPLAATAYRAFTLLCVLLGWVAFRSESLGEAKAYLLAMLGLSGNPALDSAFVRHANDYKVLLAIALLFCTPAPAKLRVWAERRFGVDAAEGLFALLGLGLLVLSVSFLVLGGHNPFIYFNF